jgi:hypothetical protein
MLDLTFRNIDSAARRRRRDVGDLCGGFLAEPAIVDSAERAPDERRNPEQPELRQRPAADEQRTAGRARPVKRRLDYVAWAHRVVDGLRGANPWLEQHFDEAARSAEESVRVVRSGA